MHGRPQMDTLCTQRREGPRESDVILNFLVCFFSPKLVVMTTTFLTFSDDLLKPLISYIFLVFALFFLLEQHASRRARQ